MADCSNSGINETVQAVDCDVVSLGRRDDDWAPLCSCSRLCRSCLVDPFFFCSFSPPTIMANTKKRRKKQASYQPSCSYAGLSPSIIQGTLQYAHSKFNLAHHSSVPCPHKIILIPYVPPPLPSKRLTSAPGVHIRNDAFPLSPPPHTSPTFHPSGLPSSSPQVPCDGLLHSQRPFSPSRPCVPPVCHLQRRFHHPLPRLQRLWFHRSQRRDRLSYLPHLYCTRENSVPTVRS